IFPIENNKSNDIKCSDVKLFPPHLTLRTQFIILQVSSPSDPASQFHQSHPDCSCIVVIAHLTHTLTHTHTHTTTHTHTHTHKHACNHTHKHSETEMRVKQKQR